MYIKIENYKLHQSIRAYEMLYNTPPSVYTCDRFETCKGESVYGTCDVLKINKTKVVVEIDGEPIECYIKDIKHFVLGS